ncbi:hypothetical protein [Dankookia sp. P2]|uniref:hypothetical protein n=1 Tax=Dankookia sp. P2 TaxID=3423955 RepID=UPI003D673583
MQQDAQGNAISAAGAEAARAFDHTIAGYLGYRSRHVAAHAGAAGGRPGMRHGACAEGRFPAARLQAGLRAAGEGSRLPPPDG